jgi:hypothetical protein
MKPTREWTQEEIDADLAGFRYAEYRERWKPLDEATFRAMYEVGAELGYEAAFSTCVDYSQPGVEPELETCVIDAECETVGVAETPTKAKWIRDASEVLLGILGL